MVVGGWHSVVAHTAFTFKSGGHLVSSGSEIFWSNWGVSVEGGILWVALPLLLRCVRCNFLGCWIMSFKSAPTSLASAVRP